MLCIYTVLRKHYTCIASYSLVHYKALHKAMALTSHKLALCESHYSLVACFAQRLIWDVRFMLCLLPANHCLLGRPSRRPRSAEKLVEDTVTLPVSYGLRHTLIRKTTVMLMHSLTVVASCLNFSKVFEKGFFLISVFLKLVLYLIPQKDLNLCSVSTSI